MRRSHLVAGVVPVLLVLGGCSAVPMASQPAVGSRTATVPARAAAATAPGTQQTTATSSAPVSPASPSEAGEGDWSSLVDHIGGAVVRLQVVGCEPGQASMGSGFVVGDHLVMTAGHVARDARSISVTTQGGVTTARVVDSDMGTDAALLATADSLGVAPLSLSEGDLRLGSDLAILGFPLGVDDLRISTGVVSGLDQSVDYRDFSVAHTFVTDAATNPGNSGGPVVDRSGKVLGLVSGSHEWEGSGDDVVPVQGTNFIVPAASLRTDLAAWRDESPRAQEPCSGEGAPPAAPPQQAGSAVDVSIESDHPHAADIALTLSLEGDGINSGSYDTVWNLFTPRMQHDMGSVTRWESGLTSSYWTSLDIRSVTGHGDVLTAHTTLRTRQQAADGYHGQTCSVFDLAYRMKSVDGMWLIDHARGGAPDPC